MHPRAVGGAVVGHHSLDAHALALVPGEGPLEESGGRLAPLVGEHLDVGEPGGVVDADMHVLPAVLEDLAMVARRSSHRATADPVPGPGDAAQLLDVDVQELARAPALVARSEEHTSELQSHHDLV